MKRVVLDKPYTVSVSDIRPEDTVLGVLDGDIHILIRVDTIRQSHALFVWTDASRLTTYKGDMLFKTVREGIEWAIKEQHRVYTVKDFGEVIDNVMNLKGRD